MRVLISGDRNYKRAATIYALLAGLRHSHPGDELVVIQGEARGADTLARQSAESLGIKVESYPAKWDEYGRFAGHIRNKQMLDEGQPDVVFCFHDDLENSKGTGHMARAAKEAGVPVYNIRRL